LTSGKFTVTCKELDFANSNMHYNCIELIFNLQGVLIKNNPLVKMLYFSRRSTDLNQNTLYASIHPTYPANFIEITDMVPQIERFEL